MAQGQVGDGDREGDDIGIAGVRAILSAKPRPVGWRERRDRLDEVGTVWPPARDVAFESVDAGGVPAEWSRAPGADPSRVLVFFHGGGYCSGSIASHRRMASEAGRAAGARALAVAYRRAPEHPFPAAIDDAVIVWRWLREQGVAAAHIVVGGDSAGGGLTLALWQRLRDEGDERPAALWLVSPWTDLELSSATLRSKDAADPLLHRGYLAELATAYAGESTADPLVSPLRADLTGLPPTLIQVGSEEVLLDDSVRLAGAAGAAGAAVTLQVWPQMIHAFPLWNGGLPDGREAIAEFGRFARAQLED